MNKFAQMMNYFTGRAPFEAQNIQHMTQILMFITDTPSVFYSELQRLIKLIQPTYIVHTGDLVDDIKLQLHPGAIRHYERQVLSLIKILEGSPAAEVYIALGNHDSPDYIHSRVQRIKVIDDADQVKINHIKLSMSDRKSVV